MSESRTKEQGCGAAGGRHEWGEEEVLSRLTLQYDDSSKSLSGPCLAALKALASVIITGLGCKIPSWRELVRLIGLPLDKDMHKALAERRLEDFRRDKASFEKARKQGGCYLGISTERWEKEGYQSSDKGEMVLAFIPARLLNGCDGEKYVQAKVKKHVGLTANVAKAWCLLQPALNLHTNAQILLDNVIRIGKNILKARTMFSPLIGCFIEDDQRVSVLSGRHRLLFVIACFGADTMVPVLVYRTVLSRLEARLAAIEHNRVRKTLVAEVGEQVLAAVIAELGFTDAAFTKFVATSTAFYSASRVNQDNCADGIDRFAPDEHKNVCGRLIPDARPGKAHSKGDCLDRRMTRECLAKMHACLVHYPITKMLRDAGKRGQQLSPPDVFRKADDPAILYINTLFETAAGLLSAMRRAADSGSEKQMRSFVTEWKSISQFRELVGRMEVTVPRVMMHRCVGGHARAAAAILYEKPYGCGEWNISVPLPLTEAKTREVGVGVAMCMLDIGADAGFAENEAKLREDIFLRYYGSGSKNPKKNCGPGFCNERSAAKRRLLLGELRSGKTVAVGFRCLKPEALRAALGDGLEISASAGIGDMAAT